MTAPRTGGSPAGLDPSQLPAGLARFINRPPPAPPGEQCELCAEAIAESHSHLVDLEGRGLLCTCRPCFLLFSHEGAAGGRYRQVPDRHFYQPVFAISDAQWDELAIPVGLAFFFHNSTLDKTVAFYPSPAGATESELSLQTLDEVRAANPGLPATEPDVEALLLRRVHSDGGGRSGEAGSAADGGAGYAAARAGMDAREHRQHFECYLVPIDACYELVGLVRTHWRGFDGGQEVWDAIEAFFAGRRERSKLVRSAE